MAEASASDSCSLCSPGLQKNRILVIWGFVDAAELSPRWLEVKKHFEQSSKGN